MINIEAFDQVEVRVGTVTEVKPNKKSRNPSYVVTIDFGPELGVKKSSAQITDLYTPEDLIGTQVVCCVNLEPMSRSPHLYNHFLKAAFGKGIQRSFNIKEP